MTIVLKYPTKDGTQGQYECSKKNLEIDLSDRGITDIDLSPLRSCNNLRRLLLNSNALTSVDLTPISTCKDIRELRLRQNDLQSIDLTPLRHCVNLVLIDLKSNQLQHIDLAPLSVHEHLGNLLFSNNQIQNLDITPLAIDRSRGKFRIEITGAQRLTAWIQNIRRFPEVVYQRPDSIYPWYFLHLAVKNNPDNFRIQQDIIRAIGFGDLGFIDLDISELLLSIHPESSFEEVHTKLRPILMHHLMESIREGRSTTGLNLELGFSQNAEITISTKQILKTREDEMEKVTVGLSGNRVDLRELWLTAYGYEVMTALKMSLETDVNGLKALETVFSNIGFKLKVDESATPGVRMSNALRNVIHWIIENTGKEKRDFLKNIMDQIEREQELAKVIKKDEISQGYEYLRKLRSRTDKRIHEEAMRYITDGEIILRGISNDAELKSFIESIKDKKRLRMPLRKYKLSEE